MAEVSIQTQFLLDVLSTISPDDTFKESIKLPERDDNSCCERLNTRNAAFVVDWILNSAKNEGWVVEELVPPTVEIRRDSDDEKFTVNAENMDPVFRQTALKLGIYPWDVTNPEYLTEALAVFLSDWKFRDVEWLDSNNTAYVHKVYEAPEPEPEP